MNRYVVLLTDGTSDLVEADGFAMAGDAVAFIRGERDLVVAYASGQWARVEGPR